MLKTLEKIIQKLKINNHQIFLIDGVGAIVSVFLLAVVLVNFENNLGVPKAILYKLSILPILFSIYSISCYFLKPAKWIFFLRSIAFGNLFYCCLTLSLILFFNKQITYLGISYFLIEIIIILILASVELKLAAKKIVILQNKIL